MLKRALRALILLPLLFTGLSPAHAAGTIAYSLSQNNDQFGVPLTGCLFYTFQAGTTSTPQNAYKDYQLTQAQPNPMVCDSAGRLPQFFLADGQIKIKLSDKFGNPQVVADNILVIGPSSGGGSGATIDPTTILATGDVKYTYGTGTLTGFVRLNGRTIGSATSGATERANLDTQNLFQYLWTADANLVVVGGRGASSIADWNANKQLTLPDGRGRVLAALDDMGNSAAGRLTGTYFGASGTTLGVASGAERVTIVNNNLPPYTPTGLITVNSTLTTGNATGVFGTVISGAPTVTGYAAGTGANLLAGSVTATFAGNAAGGVSNPVTTVQPTILVTIYMKL